VNAPREVLLEIALDLDVQVAEVVRPLAVGAEQLVHDPLALGRFRHEGAELLLQ
jgi:hypothetical protein